MIWLLFIVHQIYIDMCVRVCVCVNSEHSINGHLLIMNVILETQTLPPVFN